jgi:hypothetical protein
LFVKAKLNIDKRVIVIKKTSYQKMLELQYLAI